MLRGMGYFTPEPSDFRKHLAGLTITEPLTYLDPVSLLFC